MTPTLGTASGRKVIAGGGEGTGIDVKIIDPVDAIQWVATGRFHKYPVEPIRPWYMVDTDNAFSEAAYEDGRFDLATEMVVHAISEGRLHCAFIEGKDLDRRLEVVKPEVLLGARISTDWDAGFSIGVSWPDDDSDAVDEAYLSMFYFIWEEVAKLRPSANASEGDSALPASTPPLTLKSGSSAARRDAPNPRGRPPINPGAPIAAFLARMVQRGVEAAASETNDALGAWLIEEYGSKGIVPAPHHRNANAWARAALNAWISAMAESGAIPAGLNGGNCATESSNCAISTQ